MSHYFHLSHFQDTLLSRQYHKSRTNSTPQCRTSFHVQWVLPEGLVCLVVSLIERDSNDTNARLTRTNSFFFRLDLPMRNFPLNASRKFSSV